MSTSTTNPRLHPATIYPATTPEEVDTAATLIATAFSSLAASELLVPDPARRTAILTEVFRISVAHAVQHGTVHLLTRATEPGRGIGVAVWVDQTRPVPDPPDYESRLLAATGQYHGQFETLDLLMANHHPHVPHHHLAFLATAPDHWGTGIGTMLLSTYQQAVLDVRGEPAYLEASDQDSARLYQRHGYQLHGEPFELGPAAVFLPMWREPVAGAMPFGQQDDDVVTARS